MKRKLLISVIVVLALAILAGVAYFIFNTFSNRSDVFRDIEIGRFSACIKDSGSYAAMSDAEFTKEWSASSQMFKFTAQDVDKLIKECEKEEIKIAIDPKTAQVLWADTQEKVDLLKEYHRKFLNREFSVLKNQNKQFSEKYPQYIEDIQGSDDEVWYSIPEYGVRMRLNKEFGEELIYYYTNEINDSNEEWDALNLSTKSITDIDKGCSPEEERPLGSITRWKGNAKELAKTNDYFSSRLDSIVQIGDYYYIWAGPHAICWNPKNTDAIEKVRPPEIYGNIQDGVKTLQLIPSK